MKLTTEDTEGTELKPDQHEPVTLKLDLTYTFEPSECLPDDWEGTREELVEWFRSDMAENFHSWVNRREIYNSIQEEDKKATTTEDTEGTERNKHTPGPWIVRGGNVIESLSRVYVAKAWMTDGEEECANARLIAASPEIFSALKALLDWGREHLSPVHDPEAHALLVNAHQAIANAEGRKGK